MRSPYLCQLAEDRDEGAKIVRCGSQSRGHMRAIFGRSYAVEPDRLVEQLRADEAIAEADTLLLTVPNQLWPELATLGPPNWNASMPVAEWSCDPP
jgi:predicted dinucleotide-binding enzyme